MSEEPSGGRSIRMFMIVALLISSGLVVPLSGGAPVNLRGYATLPVGEGSNSPQILTPGGAMQMVAIADAVKSDSVVALPVPTPVGILASTHRSSLSIPGQTPLFVAPETTGAMSIEYSSNGLSQSFTMSGAAIGNPGVISQSQEVVSQQVLGGFSTSGGMVTISSNGMMVVSSGSLPSGQSAFLIQSAQIPVRSTVNINSISTFSSVTSAVPGLWMDASKRRSRSQIYVEILEVMKRGPMTPFEIAFYARLNHKRTKEYTEFLKRSGYLEALQEDGRSTLVLTKSGLSFLEKAKALFQENMSSAQMTKADYQWQSEKFNRN